MCRIIKIPLLCGKCYEIKNTLTDFRKKGTNDKVSCERVPLVTVFGSYMESPEGGTKLLVMVGFCESQRYCPIIFTKTLTSRVNYYVVSFGE